MTTRHERLASISTVRLAASHGDFHHHRVALCAGRIGATYKIAADRAADHRRVVIGADLELPGLSNFHSEPGRGGLAADVANANVRLGHGRRDCGDVDRASALVRGRVFLGTWGYAASRSYAEPALWFPGLAVHQFLYLPLVHYRRRGFPDVNTRLSTIPDLHCACVAVVGVLFRGHNRR